MAEQQSDILSPEKVTAGLRTSVIGRRVLYYPSVSSTNAVAHEMALQGAEEGLVVLADEQTAGRGRLGRRWIAPAGTSLLLSVLLRPGFTADRAPWLTMIISLATLDGIREVTGLEGALKWPNDVLLDGRKAGGILTEIGLTGDHLDFAVVGLGLNVNFDPTTVPDLPPGTTSLMLALGKQVDRLALLRAILRAADDRYVRLLAGESPHQEWAAHLATLGQHVRVHTPAGVEEGIAEGIDLNGALILRREDGTKVTIPSGDVTLRT
jgi:BirA family biotin operon repressor/biotin-[acetyl-CoA-carboxylase] ligase